MSKIQSIFNKYYHLYILLFICSLVTFSGYLSAATIFVGPPPASIQAAINSASSGDIIQLSAGIYVEPIQIVSKSLNLIGAGEDTTTIQAPPAATPLTNYFTYTNRFWCIVLVDNQAAPAVQTVNISNLTVDGSTQQDTSTLPAPSPGFYGSSDRFHAIGYHNANGTIQNVHTTSTREYEDFNELAGGGPVNASDMGIITFNVLNCIVDTYQRIGIDCRGPALTAHISNTTVNRGYVLTPNTDTATPIGIQFSGEALGSITNSIVESNISTVADAAGTGILLFGAGADAIVSGNTANNNDNGIVGVNCGNNLTIINNTLNYTTTPAVNILEGIIIQDTEGLTTITSNVMNSVPDINMDLSSTTNQPFQLANNVFNGSQTGLLVTGNATVGPQITMNHDSFTGTSGYYIQEITAPNDIWPSTATVSFDGLVSGHITLAQFNQILTKIFDKHNDPALGLVLDYITPETPILTNVSPHSGPATGGNSVTITGSGFISSDTEVFFGSIPATNVVVISDNVITATVPPGDHTLNVTVTTPFGTSPIVPGGLYTFDQEIPNAPLPPSNFFGRIVKYKFASQIAYELHSKWIESPSADVTLYRIYKNGILIATIPAGSPLVFTIRIKPRKRLATYVVVAVDFDNIESIPVTLEIEQKSHSNSNSNSNSYSHS